MQVDLRGTGFGASIRSVVEKLPWVSFYAKSRGWPFVLAWCHRVTGILLVLLAWLYVYFRFTPPRSGETDTSGSFIISVLVWGPAILLVFHSLNGGRLILYELFGKRNDESMIRWVFGLAVIYLALLGLAMMPGQAVSPFVFWLIPVVCASILAFRIGRDMAGCGHSSFWLIQRISAAVLLVILPAYLLFLQLTPVEDSEVNIFAIGLQVFFVKMTYVLLLAGTLYHGGYGLWSVIGDYLPSRTLRRGAALLLALIMLIFAGAGIRTIFTN